jgi:hypothetical protein
VVEECFDRLVGVAKVVFVKSLHVLFFYALDDALDADGGYGLLEVKLFLESLSFVLEGEDFVGALLVINFGVDGHRFDEGIRRFDYVFRDKGIFCVIKDES